MFTLTVNALAQYNGINQFTIVCDVASLAYSCYTQNENDVQH